MSSTTSPQLQARAQLRLQRFSGQVAQGTVRAHPSVLPHRVSGGGGSSGGLFSCLNGFARSRYPTLVGSAQGDIIDSPHPYASCPPSRSPPHVLVLNPLAVWVARLLASCSFWIWSRRQGGGLGGGLQVPEGGRAVPRLDERPSLRQLWRRPSPLHGRRCGPPPQRPGIGA